MHKAFARRGDAEDAYQLSVAIACDQCDALIAEGVDHLHLYTLNNPDLSFDVCRALGYVAAPLAAAADGTGRPDRSASRDSRAGPPGRRHRGRAVARRAACRGQSCLGAGASCNVHVKPAGFSAGFELV